MLWRGGVQGPKFERLRRYKLQPRDEPGSIIQRQLTHCFNFHLDWNKKYFQTFGWKATSWTPSFNPWSLWTKVGSAVSSDILLHLIESDAMSTCRPGRGSVVPAVPALSFKFDLAQLVLFLAPTEFALRNFNIWWTTQPQRVPQLLKAAICRTSIIKSSWITLLFYILPN